MEYFTWMDNDVNRHEFFNKTSSSRLLARNPSEALKALWCFFHCFFTHKTLIRRYCWRHNILDTAHRWINLKWSWKVSPHRLILECCTLLCSLLEKMYLLNLCYDDFACNLLFSDLIWSLLHGKGCIHLIMNVSKNKIIWLESQRP